MLHWRRLIVLPALALAALVAPACAVDAPGDEAPESATDPASDESLAESEQEVSASDFVLVPEPACRAQLQATTDPHAFAANSGPLLFTGCSSLGEPSPYKAGYIRLGYSNPFDNHTTSGERPDSLFKQSEYCSEEPGKPCIPIKPGSIVDRDCVKDRIYYCPCGTFTVDIPGPYPASPPGKAYACIARRPPITLPTFTAPPPLPPLP